MTKTQINTENQDALLLLKQFKSYLISEEKSQVTIEKYVRDVKHFLKWQEEKGLDFKKLTKEETLSYKKELISQYKISSANTMLVALNRFFDFIEKPYLKVKTKKVQKQIFCSKDQELTKNEYERLVKTALESKQTKLALIIQTITTTGIRISELMSFTVDGVKKGKIIVDNKGKVRTVFLTDDIRKKLIIYIGKNNLKRGQIFVTKSGEPMNRSNIWKMMKQICKKAKVKPEKVFPHNLRHLFARTYYSVTHDLAKLADLLGHSSLETTRIYIITTGKEHRRQLARLGLDSIKIET